MAQHPTAGSGIGLQKLLLTRKIFRNGRPYIEFWYVSPI
jgi:hypothetical protein